MTGNPEDNSRKQPAADSKAGPEPATGMASGVVLAGGESRRFEAGDKSVATLDGSPFIQRVVSAVESALGEPPVIAVNRESQRERIVSALGERDVTFVRDAEEFRGPVAGVAAAARVVSSPWLFLCGCDMPLLSSAAVTWLSGYCTPDIDAVVLTGDGHPQPLHSFYRRARLCDVIETLPPEAGVRALVEQLSACRRVPVSDAPESAMAAESIRNVNTTAELERLRT